MLRQVDAAADVEVAEAVVVVEVAEEEVEGVAEVADVVSRHERGAVKAKIDMALRGTGRGRHGVRVERICDW